MLLNELKAKAEVDLKVDRSQLDVDSLMLPTIVGRWLNYYNDEKLTYFKLESDRKTMYRDLWMYYSGKSDPQVYKTKPFALKVLRQDLVMFIEADPDYNTILNKTLLCKQKLDYIEQVIKTLNQRSFMVKNAIDYIKFTNGA